MTLTFDTPVWITPPAKVKKLGVITKIISNIFAGNAQGTISSLYNVEDAAEIFSNISPDVTITITPGDYDLLVLNNTARLIHSNGVGENIDITAPKNTASWHKILDLYPGKFRAGLSELRFSQSGGNEVIAYMSLDPSDDFAMRLNINTDTIPSNTIIAGRGTVDAVINPENFNPQTVATNTRYLILEDINNTPLFGLTGYQGPVAWQNADGTDFQAFANDIIAWDGSRWNIVFSSATVTSVIYITNSYTSTQYKWENKAWSKSYEGVYSLALWRMIL